MIVATAGHVDHGKTSLVRQLTGVDTDRLEEEKRRGLSINLGYAYQPVEGGSPIGFIDVPGHHRFINTMIAGVSGIDLGMLIVAADDGPMPQTVEHLDVLRLMGVQRYLLVVTKIDRVETARVDEVRSLATALLSQRNLEPLDCFPLSNESGEGVARLRECLIDQSTSQPVQNVRGKFRLSIDRSFNLKGAGLVVTGTATSGSISLGDQLLLLPQNQTLKVRSIHVQNKPADSAQAGQRCALNVGGDVEKADIERGDWLVCPEAGTTSRRLDARLELLSDLSFPVRHLSPVRLHIGAKRVSGKLYLLDASAENNKLSPSANALVQLILEQPVSSITRERFLLRDDSESVTLGGGVVLDPYAPRSGKASGARLQYLAAMEYQNPSESLQALLDSGGLVDYSHFASSWNLSESEASALIGSEARQFSDNGTSYLVSESVWQALLNRMSESFAHWHGDHSQIAGLKPTDIRAAFDLNVASPLLQAALLEMLQSDQLKLRDGLVALASHAAVATQAQLRWQKIAEALQARNLDIPLRSQLVEATGFSAKKIESACHTAAGEGLAFAITSTRYATRHTVAALAAIVLRMDRDNEPLTVINFKSHMGTGRKVAIEVLEYFDKIGFTQRNEDMRTVLNSELPGRLFSE